MGKGDSIKISLKTEESKSLNQSVFRELNYKAQELCKVISLFKVFPNQEDVLEATRSVLAFPDLPTLKATLLDLQRKEILVYKKGSFQFNSLYYQKTIRSAIDEKEKVSFYNKVGQQFERMNSYQKAIAFCLLSARKNAPINSVSAITDLEKVIQLYNLKEVSKSIPNSVYFLLAKLYDLNGQSDESSRILKFLIDKCKSIKALVKLGHNCISNNTLNIMEPYLTSIQLHSQNKALPITFKVDLMLLRASYQFLLEGDVSYIKEVKAYHHKNEDFIRAGLNSYHYIRWIYNLQNIIGYLPETPLEERIQYLFEAETLAKKLEFKKVLVYIYNVLAFVYQEVNIHKSKKFALRSANLAFETSDKTSEKRANNNLVDFARLSGDLEAFHNYMARSEQLCGQINNPQDFWLLINKIKYLITSEKYEQALNIANQLTKLTKKYRHSKLRDQAFLLKFECLTGLKKYNSVKRMLPAVEHICKKRMLIDEWQVFRGNFYLMTKCKDSEQLNQLIQKAPIKVESLIKHYITLMKLYLILNKPQAGLLVAQKLKQTIFDKGYFGFLSDYYYYSAKLYKLNKETVKSIVNYKRALKKFRRFNNERKIKEINQKLNKFSIGNQVELIDSLVKNEIMLDSIRLLQSNLKFETLVKNLAFILFEQMVIRKVYIKLEALPNKQKLLVINDQLQLINEDKVKENRLLDKMTKLQQPCRYSDGEESIYMLPLNNQRHQIVIAVGYKSIKENVASIQEEFLNDFIEFASSQLESSLLYDAMIKDDLTGLYNRNYFLKGFKKEYNLSLNTNSHLSIMMIDLDDFSLINNRFGHIEGDQILIKVSAVIRSALRKHDIVGRYGGEEIIIILPNTKGIYAKKIGERLVNEINQVKINNEYTTSASIGIASFDKDSPISIEDFINKADLAEREAKLRGKNQSICHWEIND